MIKSIPKNSEMTVYVGTCGFSYKEWIGPVYPPGTPTARLLECYSGMFPAVEIDSTYYRPPSAAMFRKYPQRTGGKLKLFLKLHSRFTHQREANSSDAKIYTEAVKPLDDAGMFSGFLAQFPQSFHSTPENREYLEYLRNLFPESPVVCEFRHKDWWHEDVLRFLSDLSFPVTTVDTPEISSLPSNEVIFTQEPAYVRLHGKNRAGWFAGAAERYTYRYSPSELKDWVVKVKKLVVKSDTVYVFFNNHPFGYAAINAGEFIELIKHALPDSVPAPTGSNNVKPEQGKLF